MFSDADKDTSSSNSLSKGSLAGIIVGTVLAVLIVLAVTAILWRRYSSQQRFSGEQSDSEGFENKSYDTRHEDYTESKNGVLMRTVSESSN